MAVAVRYSAAARYFAAAVQLAEQPPDFHFDCSDYVQTVDFAVLAVAAVVVASDCAAVEQLVVVRLAAVLPAVVPLVVEQPAEPAAVAEPDDAAPAPPASLCDSVGYYYSVATANVPVLSSWSPARANSGLNSTGFEPCSGVGPLPDSKNRCSF